MKNQQPKLSCGVDTINNRMVKSCCKELTKPMSMIIDLSISEATVPQKFKIARIIPLFKKGAANECGNYQPVSLLSALSKILEKAVCKQLMSYLESDRSLCNLVRVAPDCNRSYCEDSFSGYSGSCLLYTSPSPRD